MGLKVFDVQGSTVEEVRGFLKTSNCKVVFFVPQTETQDNLKLLRQSIPEFFNCKILLLLLLLLLYIYNIIYYLFIS
jgi:hypothetical protein